MEKLNGLRGAIFDLDGTLLNSLHVWEQIDREFFASRNIAMPPDYLDAVGSMEFNEVAEYTVKRFDLPDSAADLIKEWNAAAVRAYSTSVKLKPNALRYLNKLRECGIKLAVVTSASPDMYLPSLKNNGIINMFCAVLDTGGEFKSKSSPQIYLAAANAMGVSPCRVAVFDDMYAPLAAAKRGGFVTVGVYDGYAECDAHKIADLADCYITDFSQLL